MSLRDLRMASLGDKLFPEAKKPQRKVKARKVKESLVRKVRKVVQKVVRKSKSRKN